MIVARHNNKNKSDSSDTAKALIAYSRQTNIVALKLIQHRSKMVSQGQTVKQGVYRHSITPIHIYSSRHSKNTIKLV